MRQIEQESSVLVHNAVCRCIQQLWKLILLNIFRALDT